jgi:hypothetical protein
MEALENAYFRRLDKLPDDPLVVSLPWQCYCTGRARWLTKQPDGQSAIHGDWHADL